IPSSGKRTRSGELRLTVFGSAIQLHSHHRERARPFGLLVVTQVPRTHLLVEPDRVRLGLPLEALRACTLCVPRTVTKEPAADASSDPLGLDPEIREPPHFASRFQRAPADRPLTGLRNEGRELAELRGREVAAVGPFPHLVQLVAPEGLRRDGDLLQPQAFVQRRGPDGHAASRLFSQSAFRIAKASQSLLKYA